MIPSPRLQTDQTFDQTNAEADKGHGNESQDKGIGNDDINERAHPFDCLGNESGNIGENSGNGNISSREKTFFLNMI